MQALNNVPQIEFVKNLAFRAISNPKAVSTLLTAIPYIGENIAYWLWGGFSVSNATLTRFFSFHYLMPFILTALVIGHILILHEEKSNNPVGEKSPDHVQFTPYFSIKDLYGAVIF